MTHSTCPVCNQVVSHMILDRKNVPVHQHLLFDTEEQARQIGRGELKIMACVNCSFIFNAMYAPDAMSYDERYENTQSYSEVFEEQLNETIDYLIEEKGVKNSRVIEIGCGKGHFLQKLVEKGENSGIGFDPSYLGPLERLGGKLLFKRTFYDESSADFATDTVICRHVIEHLGNPLDMLKTIRNSLVNSPQAQVFFETPDVEWILQNKVVWDFFYEHCSYFSSQSIAVAFERAGFHVETVKKTFSGQYLWVEARPAFSTEIPFTPSTMPVVALAENFEKVNLELAKQWKEKITHLKKDGNLLVWGAGAKGVTFANLFDPERKYISCVVDINPNKQGKYLPGTGHSIISPEEVSTVNNVSAIIIMNPNYRDEIEALVRTQQVFPSRLVEFSARSL